MQKFLFFFTVVMIPFLFSAEKDLKVSIAIPCIYKHFSHIEKLIDLYAKQTVRPDEIVISLSESNLVDPQKLLEVENKKYPFNVVIKKSNDRQSAGKNRNIAAENSFGEIIILQDADDLPHPQRVEIVKYFFNEYDIDHLLHFWIPDDEWKSKNREALENFNTEFENYEKNKIQYFYKASVKEIFDMQKPVHFGNLAIRRKVHEEIKWSNEFVYGEDTQFNDRILSNPAFKSLIVEASLLKYRNLLSEYNWGNIVYTKKEIYEKAINDFVWVYPLHIIMRVLRLCL